MPHPLMSVLENFERPPQFLRIERSIPLDIGMEGRAIVDFVVHEKDEMGTTLRVTDVRPGGNNSNSDVTRAGEDSRIIPSPSA